MLEALGYLSPGAAVRPAGGLALVTGLRHRRGPGRIVLPRFASLRAGWHPSVVQPSGFLTTRVDRWEHRELSDLAPPIYRQQRLVIESDFPRRRQPRADQETPHHAQRSWTYEGTHSARDAPR